MATIIVGHKYADMDCYVSMLALETAIRKVMGYGGRPRFAFVLQGKTYKGIKVNPKSQYEQVGEDRVYHADCGLGFFDHHRPGCTAPSSAAIIDKVFKLSEKLPEWKRLIQWATDADQGRLNCGCAIPALIRGRYRLYGPGRDHDVLRIVERDVDALLANEKVLVAGAQVAIQAVSKLDVPEPGSGPTLQVMEIPSFGKLGLIVGPEVLGGTLRNRLEREANCRLMISFTTDKGKTGIMSRYARSKKSPVDLRKAGIVAAIRNAEVAKGGGADVWFAHEVPDKGGVRVANLFNGSAKFDLTEENRTRLSKKEIIKIVKDTIAASLRKN